MKQFYPKKIFANSKSIKLMLFAFLLISGIYNSYSQVQIPFTPRASVFTPDKTNYTIKGDFTMIGNTNMELSGYSYPTNQHNGNAMKYVDIDGDDNTWNSSSAFLNFSEENGALPDCSNIIYAGLYWTGRASNTGTDTDTFQITKSRPTGNNITRSVSETNNSIFDNDNISNTNYRLDITTVTGSTNANSYTQFEFTSSGTGDSVTFKYYNDNSTNVQVSRNNAPFTTIAGTYNSNNNNQYFSLTTSYQIFTDSNYTLSVSRLRKNSPARAFVNVTYNETVPETVNVTKNFDKRKVSIKGPGALAYEPLEADGIYFPTTDDQGRMFSAYTDVTEYVKQHGIGNYFVADIALREGNGGDTGYYGGWGMVVVYENSKMKWRDITVFDGHAYVRTPNANEVLQYELPISGFNAVQNGAVNLKLGLMAGEGDINYTGDYFRMRRQDNGVYENLSYSGSNVNPNNANNFFNSAIVTGGNTRNPNHANNTGLDIVMFNINNSDKRFITNNQTSTSFTYGSVTDTYIIFNATFSVDAYIPEPEAILSTTAVNTSGANPNVLLPGESAEYKIDIRNRGTEATDNTIITIPLPYTSNFQSLSYIGSSSFTPPNTPVYDANAGATGSIIWNLGTLPTTGDPNEILASISFTLTATTDCALLVNSSCTPSISLGGTITGLGSTSNTSFNQSLIQGYINDGTSCDGEPIPTPNIINIDSEAYVVANCGSYSHVKDFYYCNIGTTPIQTSQINASFPPGTKYYNEYPLTSTSVQYNGSKPFPATIGITRYFAIPPGTTPCYFEFTIEVDNITSVPTTEDITYCFGETANALTATPSDASTSPSAFTLYYYTDNNPATAPQTSIVPSTTAAGTVTYYVAEGYSNSCISLLRVPINVTVYGNDITFIAPDALSAVCDINEQAPYADYAAFEAAGGSASTSNSGSAIDTASFTLLSEVADTNSNPKIVTRTYQIANLCGNKATVTQTITINDTTAPVIPILADLTDECSVTATAPTTNDDCAGTITATTTDPLTYSAQGTFVINWTFDDGNGNSITVPQNVIVKDANAPILSTPYDAILNVSCTDIPDAPSLQFTDDCTVNVTVVFEETSSFNENVLSDYQIVRTWTVTDASDNTAKFTQTINVSLDETVTQITGEDKCYDDGIIDLNTYLTTTNSNGTWELIQGNTAATLTGSLFDPTTLSISADFLPQDGGIDYVFRYTTTENGCVSITELTMNINADCDVLPCQDTDVLISKAVTPNGDFKNDALFVSLNGFCGYKAQVKIFNRWGALVFESNDYPLVNDIQAIQAPPTNSWQGTSDSHIGRADILPNGTYYYIITFENSGFKPFTGPIYLGTK